MSNKINIGIIGAGFGQQVHVPAFRTSPLAEVRAICASRLDRAQQAARALGIAKACDRWEDLVADPGIEALALAVPPAIQAPIALAAARAGKHLFCEKPLALDGVQARQILEAARATKIVHALDFIFPEITAWQKARETVQSGVLGPLRQVALTWRVETYAYRAHVQNWKTSAAQGGGTLNNLASHSVYYLEWLLGPIARVSASLEPRHAEVEARVNAWLEFAGGCTGTVSISADAYLGTGHQIEVYGDGGTLVLQNTSNDHARGFKLFLGTRQTNRLEAVPTAEDATQADGRIEPVSRIARRFLETIAAGGQVKPNLEDGCRAQTLLDTLRLAHQSGSWQTVGSLNE